MSTTTFEPKVELRQGFVQTAEIVQPRFKKALFGALGNPGRTIVVPNQNFQKEREKRVRLCHLES